MGDEEHSYLSVPLLVRPGTSLAVGGNDTKPDYDFGDGVTLHLYELEDGKSATAVVPTPGAKPSAPSRRLARAARSMSPSRAVCTHGRFFLSALTPWRLSMRVAETTPQVSS
jgi:hypothetical protein